MKRKRTFKSRKGKRRFTRGKKKTTFAAKVKKVVLRQEETKYSSYSIAPAAISSGNAAVIMLPQIIRGTLRQHRTGNQITITWQRITFAIQNSSILVHSRYRIMVIRDKSANGLFVPTTPAAIPPADPVAPITVATDWFVEKSSAFAFMANYDQTTVGPRYQILYDKKGVCHNQGGATDQAVPVTFTWRDSKHYEVIYNDSASADYPAVQMGTIYLVVYTDNGAGSGINLSYSYEFKWKDA